MLAHLARAAEAETAENWPAAVNEYRFALDLEPTLADARDGLDRSGHRLELTQKMSYHLGNPERLSTPEVLGEAADLVAEARTLSPRGPRVADLIDRLDGLVIQWSTPVPVVLESDGLTEVTLFRVGQLGAFDRRTLELRPGTYTAIGRRAGFRDVRLSFTVDPGRPTTVRDDPLLGDHMTPSLTFIDSGERRVFEPHEWPLSIGGADCSISIDGPDAHQAVAHLGVADGAVFVQPAGDAVIPIHCNGIALTVSRWLEGGDMLTAGSSRLEVRIDRDRVEIELGPRSIPVPMTPPPPVSTTPTHPSAIMVEPVSFTPRTGGAGGRRRRLGLGSILLWSALLLLAVLAWVVFTGRTIEIVVEPTPDRLEVHGSWPVLPIDGRSFIHPGSYRVEAELAGYRPLAETLEINGDSGSQFRLHAGTAPGTRPDHHRRTQRRRDPRQRREGGDQPGGDRTSPG